MSLSLLLKRLKKKVEAMTIGEPTQNPDIGPVITKQDMEKVLGYIESGVKEGATLVCGGKRYTEGECADDYFILPTIFDNCSPDMKIVREEIFGPVVTIQTFKTEEEAVNMANDTQYGLAGAVFTCHIIILLNIALTDDNLTVILLCQLRDDRCNHAARTTPSSPQVNHQR